jgi:hypothetical protein
MPSPLFGNPCCKPMASLPALRAVKPYTIVHIFGFKSAALAAKTSLGLR